MLWCSPLFVKSFPVEASSLQMSLIQKGLKEIKHRDEYLLVGYICTAISNSLVVPDGIIQICLLFYLIFETWDENAKGETIKISNSSKTICECADDSYQMIAGPTIYKQSESAIHRWKLKLLKYTYADHFWKYQGIGSTQKRF